jgi:hypothetical protein
MLKPKGMPLRSRIIILWRYIHFQLKSVLKWLVLLFKWHKEIKPYQLSYFREWRFEKAQLVIHFNFKNAIYYKINNIKRVNCDKPIILDLDDPKSSNVEFIVYGFFRKKIYIIDTKTSDKLVTEKFKTKINRLNSIKSIYISLVSLKRFPKTAKTIFYKLSLRKQLIKLNVTEIETNIKPITLNFKNFNQNEYI